MLYHISKLCCAQFIRAAEHVTNDMVIVQVWNANACNAVVGAFNLQGSSWDRTRRQYRIHNSKPPTLKTEVLPSPCPVLPALTNARYQFAC